MEINKEFVKIVAENPELPIKVFISGECCEDTKDGVVYIKNQQDRTVMKFDVPKIPETERENRKQIDEIWEKL